MRSLPTLLNSDHPPLPVWIRAASGYLLLPFIVFAIGWLRPLISIPLLACVAISVGFLVFAPGLKSISRPTTREILACLAIAAIAIGFTLLNGLTELVPQSPDQLKHNLILGDLIDKPWPVRYEGGRYLCYGLGYYMVPAAIAKVTGPAFISTLSFVWATLGIFLFFLGLARFLKPRPITGIIIFLFCSGLGACWHLVKSGHLGRLIPAAGTAPADLLMDLGLYTSNLDSFTRVLYQPQHAIAGWLSALVILELLRTGRWTESAVILAATAFWSPITAMALAVIGVVALITHGDSLRLRPVAHLIAATAVGATVIAYYLPHTPIAESGFIWKFSNSEAWLPWYLLFVAFFVAIPVSAILWLDFKHPYLEKLKPLVFGMVVLLCLSPLYKFGHFGDMRMQLSGPAFLIIALAMTLGLARGPAPGRLAPFLYLSAVFLVGAVFPLLRTLDNVARGNSSDYRISTLRENGLNHITDLRMPGFDVTAQYLGKDTAPTARILLKPSTR